MNIYDKSPMNYTGGKYRLLPQIMEYFPKDVNVMVDLFAGGCDVCSNFKANKIYANDINNYIIDIYKKMQSMPINDVLNYIDTTIKEFELSMYNQEAYLKFRQYYNQSQNRNPLDLYVLICYSFNYQFRFNNKHEFNSPFGRNRSSFNDTMRENLIKFRQLIPGQKEHRLMLESLKSHFLPLHIPADFLIEFHIFLQNKGPAHPR